MGLIVPEIIIQDTVDLILDTIISNWNANVDKTNTILYRLWHDQDGNPVIHGSYNYYDQSQSVFLKTDANKRKLKITASYPRDKKEFPTMVVNVPSESQGATDALGFNLNSSDVTFDDANVTSTNNTARSFDGVYSILIISDNKNEVGLIYHTIRAGLITESVLNHLELSCFKNLSITGRELQKFDSDLVPFHFIRAINVKGFTEQVVDDFIANSMAQNITFGGLSSDTLSLDGGLVTGLDSLAYTGSLGANAVGATWTNNSDATGNSNSNDTVVLSFFNYNKNQWVYFSDDAVRSNGTLQKTLPNSYAWSDNDKIEIFGKVVRDNKESTTSRLNVSFIV